MKRNEFLKACASGVCGCGVLGLLPPVAVRAEEKKEPSATAPATNQRQTPAATPKGGHQEIQQVP
jgi:hypothetical protein